MSAPVSSPVPASVSTPAASPASASRPAGAAPGPGRDARNPAQFSFRAWRAVLGRVWTKSGTHNVGLMAAGVAFYAFLSIVPVFGALVMTYGLFADPATVAQHMQTIINLVPKDAAKLIYDQLISVSTTAKSKAGLGLLIAILVSIYGATRASGAMMSALNVIYEEEEQRNIVRTTFVSMALILGAIAVGIAGLLAATLLGYLGTIVAKLGLGLGPIAAFTIKVATWAVAAGLTGLAVAACYRYAPDRASARWRWLSIGSILATLLWVAATVGFGFYAAHFGNYNATYGALGAVVVLLMWLYLSAYAMLAGGLLNAELERQTGQDSTTGPERPIGRRGATMADTVPGPAADPVADAAG